MRDSRVEILPGSSEQLLEGYLAGFKLDGKSFSGRNFGSEVLDTSAGSVASIRIIGYLGERLELVQDIFLLPGWHFFLTRVALKNVDPSREVIRDVRFARCLNPSGLRQSGYTATASRVAKTIPQDGIAVVSAAGHGSTQPLQPMLFLVSDDTRAVGSFGDSSLLPASVDDAVLLEHPKNREDEFAADTFLSMSFNAGDLLPHQTKVFTFFTAMSMKDPALPISETDSEVLGRIQAGIRACSEEETAFQAACDLGLAELRRLLPAYQQRVLSSECRA